MQFYYIIIMGQQKVPNIELTPFSINAGFEQDGGTGTMSILRGAVLVGDSATNQLSYDADTSPNSFPIEDGLCVYLNITFANEVATKLSLESSNGGAWWPGFPNLRTYVSGQPKLAKNQANLYCCVASVGAASSSANPSLTFYGRGLSINRYLFNDLILFKLCDGFIFMPSPSVSPSRP